MEKNDGGPAFPTLLRSEYSDVNGNSKYNGIHGMTMRDWFAGMALTGVMLEDSRRKDNFDIAQFCYAIADAMLAERDK